MPSKAHPHADPKDDRFFGSKKGAANKAFRGLVKQYGLEEGMRIYFALKAKNKKRMNRGRKS